MSQKDILTAPQAVRDFIRRQGISLNPLMIQTIYQLPRDSKTLQLKGTSNNANAALRESKRFATRRSSEVQWPESLSRSPTTARSVLNAPFGAFRGSVPLRWRYLKGINIPA